MLEASNVEPVRELIELIRTQRAFELNSQSIQSADEALRQRTAEIISQMRVSGEGQEGLNAFLEKRTPRWSGKE